MVWIIGKEYDLNQLKEVDINEQKNRGNVPILCIDDEGLSYENIIRNHGFNLKVVNDIEDIKAVEAYPIIICDINGVGKFFESKYEGAHIIGEIKKLYPEKIVIAYTGKKHDARFNRFFSMSDYVLSKDIDGDDWVEKLDQIIEKVIDPIEQWKRIRKFLLEKDVSTKNIYLLEMEFVESILTKDKSKFARKKTIKELNPDIRSVLNSFVASLIFKLVIG